MQLGISADTKDFEKTLQGWERDQLPFATARALTQTGQLVKNAVRGTMGISFDRPTPYTLNSVYLKPATKTNLVAEVNLKNWASKGAPPSRYLQPQVQGGGRPPKYSEIAFQKKGILPGGMLWVPGKGAKLNQYGNIMPSLIVQIMSATGSHWKAGYTANVAKHAEKRINKTTLDIFVSERGGHLPFGVYQRMANGDIKPLLIFVEQVHYSVRLPFKQIATNVYNVNFARLFEASLRDALILAPMAAAA